MNVALTSSRRHRQEIVSCALGLLLIGDALFNPKPGAWSPGPHPEFSTVAGRTVYSISIVVPIVVAIWGSEVFARLIQRWSSAKDFQGSWIRAGAWTLLAALCFGAILSHF